MLKNVLILNTLTCNVFSLYFLGCALGPKIFLRIVNSFYWTFCFHSCFKFFNTCCSSKIGCPKKHGNSVTNSISSLLWISIVIPNFKRHNIMSAARVYFMKTVNGCKDVSIMSPQDKKWIRTSLLCLYTVIFLFY